jgi:hypothetical protein
VRRCSPIHYTVYLWSDDNAIIEAAVFNMNSEITLTELEQAINYWRMQRPSLGEERALSPEVDALASIYALMIFNRDKSLPLNKIDTVSVQLLEAWRNSGSNV